MDIRKSMSAPVRALEISGTIADAARLMAEADVGALPVLENGQLCGIITDRDIAIRAVARGLDPGQPVARAMTYDVVSCPETACIDDVLELMATHGVRRIPVRSAQGRLVGIVSLSDLARIDWDKAEVGKTLDDICRAASLAGAGPVSA